MKPRLYLALLPYCLPPLAGFAIAGTSLSARIHEKLMLPWIHHLREICGRAPTLNPQLKILAIDSRTVAHLGRSELTAAEWRQTLQVLARLRPGRVLIDKVFGVLPSGSPAEVSELVQLRETRMAIFAGAIAAPQAIPERKLLAPEHMAPGDGRNENLFVYGPDPRLLPLFTGVGHLLYEPGGRLRPELFPDPAHRIAHLAWQARPDSERASESILPDYVPAQTLWQNTFSIEVLFTPKVNEIIRAGDTVLLLTQVHANGTDFIETPVGLYPGGFLLASAVNGVLSDRQIRTLRWPAWATALLLAVCVTLALSLPVRLAYPAAAAIPLLLVSAQLAAFLLERIELMLVPGILATTIGSAGVLLWRSYQQHQQTSRLRRSLEGVVSANRLKALLARPDSIQWRPAVREVTVVFVDMAGFSLLAEKRPPQEVYTHLRRSIVTMTETIHEFGGIVDRTLGDGLLAFFGYGFSDASNDPAHAATALACAAEIQRRHLKSCENEKQAGLIHPLRIGVNTGRVFVGDLGDRQRVDFTIVGHAVNLAQRLEAACDDFEVLCSAATRDALRADHELHKRFREKLISIKHARAPLLAFQFDPLFDRREWKHRAIAEYRKASGLQRSEARIPVAREWRVSSSFFEGRILNFSLKGILVESERQLGRGVVTGVRFPDGQEYLMEVRWSEWTENGVAQIGLRHLEPSQERLHTLNGFLGKGKEAA